MDRFERNWLPLAVALGLVALAALGQWIAQGHGRLKRDYIYRGLDLTIAALSAQLAYLSLDRKVPNAKIDAYVANVNITSLLLFFTFLMFIAVAYIHDYYRRRRNRLARRQNPVQPAWRGWLPELLVLGLLTNLVGLFLLFGFVALVDDAV